MTLRWWYRYLKELGHRGAGSKRNGHKVPEATNLSRNGYGWSDYYGLIAAWCSIESHKNGGTR